MKRLTFLLIALITAISISAQHNGNGARPRFSPEQFKKEMENFIAREAELSEQEQQKFFPMMHEMFNKQRELNNKKRELMKKCNERSSENDYAYVLDQITSLEIKNKEIEKEYYQKFHKALSYKKIYNVRRSLSKFNRELIKKFAPRRRK